MFSLEARIDEPLNETSRRVADDGTAWRGQILQARGEVHRVAHGGRLGPLALDRRHHRDTRIHAHAHDRALPEPGFDLGRRREGGADRQCCPACPEGCVLLRLRDAEHGHNAVAGEAAYRTAMSANDAGQLVVDRSDETEGFLLAKPLHNGGVSNHVGEEHGDLTPVAWNWCRRRALGGAFPHRPRTTCLTCASSCSLSCRSGRRGER
jgi:hypothetical protein